MLWTPEIKEILHYKGNYTYLVCSYLVQYFHLIRLDLSEIGWKGADWMHLAQDRNSWQALMNTLMNLQVT